MMLELILKDITDSYVRENFKRIVEFIRGDSLRKSQFKFFEVTFAAGTSNYRYRHGLGYRPKDFLATGVTNGETVIFNVDLCDKDYIDMTVSGSCTVRFFAGAYRENL